MIVKSISSDQYCLQLIKKIIQRMSALLATDFLPILYNHVLKICPWGQLLLF